MKRGIFVSRQGWKLVFGRAECLPTREEKEALDDQWCKDEWERIKAVVPPWDYRGVQPTDPDLRIRDFARDPVVAPDELLVRHSRVTLEEELEALEISKCWHLFKTIPEWALAPKKKGKRK